jgi:hypothetical protein
MLNFITKNKPCLTTLLYQSQRRNKITITKLDSSKEAQVARPTPILLLRTILSKDQEKSSK